MLIKVRSQKSEVRSERRNNKSLFVLFIVLFSVLFSLPTNAQCAMCRAALETEGNALKSQAVNDGIVYLMVIPYLLVGGIGYYIYRMRKKKSE